MTDNKMSVYSKDLPNDTSEESLDQATRLLKNAQEDAARLLKNAQDDASRMVRNAQEDAARLLKNTPGPKAVPVDTAYDAGYPEPHKTGERIVQKNDKLYTVGEMSSRLAHDLQNPLTIIKNTIEILKIKQPNIDENTKEQYGKINRAVAKMSQQIRDVLNYVRTSNMQIEETSFLNLLKSVLNDLDVPENLKIILPTEDIVLRGDVKQLEVAFSNLILNSIQAIGNAGKIMIQALDNEQTVDIDVIDNGHGIERKDLPHIFEPLYTTKQTGTGLGLASCKAIIENHGGSIECSSIVGKGTVFTIHLPKNV